MAAFLHRLHKHWLEIFKTFLNCHKKSTAALSGLGLPYLSWGCHIWAVQSSLSCLDRVKKCPHGIGALELFPLLFHKRNVASLSLLYHNLHVSWRVPFLTILFSAKPLHVTYTRVNHLHFFRIWLVSRKFHLDSLFQQLLLCGTGSTLIFYLLTSRLAFYYVHTTLQEVRWRNG